jgi:trimethyllysine dioxygenase
MATRIRYCRLTRLCGSSTARQDHTLRNTRSFSGTRIFAQDTETAPTHGFSNGQNLGSISLKRNGVYLENKLRIVGGVNYTYMMVRF